MLVKQQRPRGSLPRGFFYPRVGHGTAHAQIRAIDVLRARKEGWTFAKIAEEFGISKDHARQLSIKGQRLVHELWSNDPRYELSVRTRNAITAVGVVLTPDGVRRHFRSAEGLKQIPNIGNKGIAELQDWLVRHGKKPIP